MQGRRGPVVAVSMVVVSAVVLVVASSAGAALTTRNITPFPASKVIVGARWSSPRYDPPSNMWGDILPTVWGDDGNQYTMMDDGGTDITLSGGIWKQSMARITGSPPNVHFTHIGNPNSPPPHNRKQISANRSIWLGPLGPYYSSGLLAANHFFYATQETDWKWGQNGLFTGLHGIAFSADRGAHWTTPSKPFPAPLGNLNWVIRGRGGFFPDGFAYAIATEKEFNADTLIVGRAKANPVDITDPVDWQWMQGSQNGWPVFSSSFESAKSIVSWPGHITYPQMAYDSPIHRYLLTFTYSYSSTTPGIWKNGMELVILEAPHPWGPFSFVAHEPNFGPSNGYGAGFPIKWISGNGKDLWMKWAANFAGCQAGLNCSGVYGFNYRKLHLTVSRG